MKKSLLTQQINENRDVLAFLGVLRMQARIQDTHLPLEEDESEELGKALDIVKKYLVGETEFLEVMRDDELSQEDPAYSSSSWTKQGGGK